MNLFFPFLGLGLTAGGVFSGILQQNLSQAEKPYINTLFEDIVRKMKEFSGKNHMTKKKLLEIKFASSSEDSKRNNGVFDADDTKNSSEYTFQSLTNIWMGLLSAYIKSWYDKTTNIWGTKENPYLKVKEAFIEENKKNKIIKAEDNVKKRQN